MAALNINEAIKQIKFSTNPYIEQLFQSKKTSLLSERKIEKIVKDLKKEYFEKNRPTNLDDYSQDFDSHEPQSQDEQKELDLFLQTHVSHKINEILSDIGQSVHDHFLSTHKPHILTLNLKTPKSHYCDYFIQSIISMLPMKMQSDMVCVALIDNLKEKVSRTFLQEVLLLDNPQDLGAFDITKIELLYFSCTNTLRIKYTSLTPAYLELLKSVLQKNDSIVHLIYKIFCLSNILKLNDEKENSSSRQEVIKKVLSMIITNKIRISEHKLEQFFYKISTLSNYQCVYSEDFSEVLSIEQIAQLLNDKSVNTLDYKEFIMHKIMNSSGVDR